MKIRNIGLFAHVDTGKTTLSEQILERAGLIRKAGNVDDGTTFTDNLPIEQRRGISVKASAVTFPWKGVEINLIDTPGHADFASEIERSLWALDCAVLLVDAVDGIQPQTELLYQTLQKQKIPHLFFINKIDREGADPQRVIRQLRQILSAEIVPMAEPDEWMEIVCAHDDALLNRYLNEEEIPQKEITQKLQELSRAGVVHPLFTGSALHGQGVEELLDGIIQYLPDAPTETQELSGVVFNCQEDKVMGRGLLLRLYGGKLENRQPLAILRKKGLVQEKEERKITQIRSTTGRDLGRLEAGMVGLVYGLGNLEVGHIFGNERILPRAIQSGMLRTPLIAVQVLPENPDQMNELRKCCQILSEEDPMLQVKYTKALNQLNLRVMGMVQLEILQEILLTRFQLRVQFSEPSVIYKETIRQAARGYIDYTMPKPCWAILEFQIEPAPRGSGVSFSSQVPFKQIQERYQHQVEEAIPMALKQGRLGWETTDLKITLTGGCHHLEHTHPLDFIVATPMGIHNGLHNGGSLLLEPILEAKIMLPAEQIGRVISDINLMQGDLLNTETLGERVLLTALLPVRTSLKYATSLAILTGGKGSMNVRLHSYREAPPEVQCTAPRRTIDPLDTAKFILVVRNALEGTLFEEA